MGGCYCVFVCVWVCVFLHDKMDCLQVHSGEENLEVKEQICESKMQGDTRWIR